MITFALLLEGDCLFNLCFSLRRDSLVLLDEASQLKLLGCVRCVSCIFLGCQNFVSQWVKKTIHFMKGTPLWPKAFLYLSSYSL